jgi:hypothetical protein
MESWDGCLDWQYQLGGRDEVDGLGGEVVEVLHEASNLSQLWNLLRMSHSGRTPHAATAVAASQCNSQLSVVLKVLGNRPAIEGNIWLQLR